MPENAQNKDGISGKYVVFFILGCATLAALSSVVLKGKNPIFLCNEDIAQQRAALEFESSQEDIDFIKIYEKLKTAFKKHGHPESHAKDFFIIQSAFNGLTANKCNVSEELSTRYNALLNAHKGL